MKDPRCGSAAVMIIGLMLIAKFSALSYLVEQRLFVPLLLAPLIGRVAPLILFLTTPTVNPSGLAQYFIEHANPQALKLSIALALLSVLLISGVTAAAISIVFCAIILWALRKLMLARLGGHSGDTLGASIEITELALLITACATGFNALS
jgi:adenosylcobinamide-GDP ribazoletransferase